MPLEDFLLLRYVSCYNYEHDGKKDNLLIGLLFIAPSMYAAIRNDSIETDIFKDIDLKR